MENLVKYHKKYVTRINLKTECGNKRPELMKFCLPENKEGGQNQYLAIGWSCVYSETAQGPDGIRDYEEYYNAAVKHQKANKKDTSPALNRFKETQENDLFWTRDLNGRYWICRAKSGAQPYCDADLDIGAVVPVEAYCYGLEVPGQIKASFNRANGGTAARICDKAILEFSKSVFNNCAKTDVYEITKLKGNLFDNLPDFDLEELVIAYIQIKYDYYVLSNSIAKKSTTIAIECEFRSKDASNPSCAVVQVKGGHDKTLAASTYKDFLDKGYRVFLYAPHYTKDYDGDVVYIDRDDLMSFYNEYKAVLPDSITKWENLFS